MKEQKLLSLLKRVFKEQPKLEKRGDEAIFHCPNCNHSKKKLYIQLSTQKFHCWVCGFKGRRISQIFRKIQPQKIFWDELKEIDKEYSFKDSRIKNKISNNISLPKGCIPVLPVDTDSILNIQAYKYLTDNRGLRNIDILRYDIHYCNEGKYYGKIIIPSYYHNQLNYFIARDFTGNSFKKYEGPENIDKNIIFFYDKIAWKLPVILVEGVFDAIKFRGNAIPMLGKFPSRELIKELINNEIKEVYISLDSDAYKDMILLSQRLSKLGISSKLIKIEKGDPAETEFETLVKLYNEANQLSFRDILTEKLRYL